MSTPASNSSLESRITIDPALCNGKPTLRGKRITVQTILEFLGAGETREELLHQYPSLEEADIDACLAFAAKYEDEGFSRTDLGGLGTRLRVERPMPGRQRFRGP